jgi:Tol biopolymer transport system component
MRVQTTRLVRGLAAVSVAAGLVVVLSPSAEGAFPGDNGLLAYEQYTAGTDDTDIMLMAPDGSGQTPIAAGAGAAGGPVFSADGTKIVYTAGISDDAEIWSMNADGSNKTQLTDDDDQDAQPWWSPDGTQIVYRAFAGGHYDLFVMNADGTGSVNITNTPNGSEFNPSWSPDGSRIAFGGRLDETEDFEIWSIAPDGNNRLQLTDDDLDSSQPDWAPDGSKVVYSLGSDDLGYDLWTVEPDGSDEALLLDLDENLESPAYSPDGTRIAFGAYNGTETNVWVAAADGANPVLINNNYTYSPSWQPVGPAPTTTTTTIAPTSPTTAPRPTPVAAAVAVRPSFTG